MSPTQPDFATWDSPAAFETARASGLTCWIFKHSTRCSISSAAHLELEKHAAAGAGLPVYRILVVENRPTSTAIAAALGVPHASPQAILLRSGTVAWTASHWDITAEALAAAERGSS